MLKSSKRRQKERIARAMAKSMLADPKMRDRVKKCPRLKREVRAKCLHWALNDKMTEANYVFQEAKKMQFRYSGKHPLNAVRCSMIADRAAATISMLQARSREAAEQGRPDPTSGWPVPAARNLMEALRMYADRRRSPSVDGFDRWLWKKCWLYADQRRMYRRIVADLFPVKRAFPRVRIDWMVIMQIEAIVRQGGADRHESQQVFLETWS